MNSWTKWLFFALLVITPLANAAIPSADWKTLESEHFFVHFLPENRDSAKRATFIAERLYTDLKNQFNWEPKEKISMLLTDDFDLANGSATPVPFNLVKLLLYPPDSVNSLDDYDDWLTLLIEHELTHIFHIDKGRGKIIKLRNTFGRFLLFFPNLLQPGWLVEGLATYHETKAGVGRGQSSSFEMLMRAELQRGFSPVSQINLPPDSLPLNRQYLYGVYFYQFLETRYGEPAIDALIENYSNNILPFAINSNSREILGKDISQLWDEFKIYIQNRFQPQIVKLNSQPSVSGKVVVNRETQLTNLAIADDGSLLYVQNNYQSQAKLVRYYDDKVTELVDVNGASYFNILENTSTIYLTQLDFCNEYQIFYDLYRYDEKTGELEQLTECQRYKQFTIDSQNKRLYAVKTVDSIPRIDELDLDGKKIKTVWTGKYGDVINQLDWSASRQKLLVTRKQQNQSWSIFEFNNAAGTWEVIVKNNSINVNASYSQDQNSIFYSSDQTGVFNIYNKQLESAVSPRSITHVLSGAFIPQQDKTGAVYYLNFNAEGYRVYQVANNDARTVTIKPSTKKPNRYNDSLLKNIPDYPEQAYSPWPDLKPRYWLPLLEVQDKGTEVGFATSSNDSLDHHFYELNFIYGVDQNDILGSFFYQYENWLGFAWSKENTLYTDSANNTALIRTNAQQQLSLVKPVTAINSQWRFRLGLIGNNEKDTYRAIGVTGFEDNYDNLLGLSIYFNNKKNYLRGNSPENGRDVLLVTESSDVFKSDYEGRATTFEWREFMSLGNHHVLAFRLLKGQADSTMRPYRLGGLKTEWDDVTLFNPGYSRDIFNKRGYALRGYDENIQIGNNIELLSLEYRFPLQQLERGFMTPPIGLIKHSGRVFTEAGASWYDGDNKNVISSAGIEWVLETNLIYFLNLDVRLGYAKGLDTGGDDFYYLKVGSAF